MLRAAYRLVLLSYGRGVVIYHGRLLHPLLPWYRGSTTSNLRLPNTGRSTRIRPLFPTLIVPREVLERDRCLSPALRTPLRQSFLIPVAYRRYVTSPLQLLVRPRPIPQIIRLRVIIRTSPLRKTSSVYPSQAASWTRGLPLKGGVTRLALKFPW